MRKASKSSSRSLHSELTARSQMTILIESISLISNVLLCIIKKICQNLTKDFLYPPQSERSWKRSQRWTFVPEIHEKLKQPSRCIFQIWLAYFLENFTKFPEHLFLEKPLERLSPENLYSQLFAVAQNIVSYNWVKSKRNFLKIH